MGQASGPDGWVVDLVLGPTGERRPIALAAGAVATSSPAHRRWTRDGRVRHHLIDPRSGESIESDIVAVSIVAAEAWQADVLTKAVFVRGVDAGLALVESLGADALVLLDDGVVRSTAGWDRLRGRPRPGR